MVSLDHDSTRQGGYFFANEGSASNFANDEEELIGNGLTSDDSPRFMPLRTAWAAVIQIIILIAWETLVFLIPLMIFKNDGTCSFVIIIYIQACMWLLFLFFERVLHYAHRRSMRMGYLQFYRRTQTLKRVPLYTVSIGCVALLVLSGAYLRDQVVDTTIWPMMYIQIIASLETVLAGGALLRYTVLVIRFNQKRCLPDVEQEEFNTSITQPSATLPDIGYRDVGYLENLLEKQADMIHYLRLHTAYLSKKILRLTRLTHPSTSGNAMNNVH
ncbi:transmembrane protein 192-like [Diadema setosum]|uniref:transmembrane protein 192-like n=1 Tax=Diadema setosum TaxID=31175 RepID=UPI003B3BCEA0